MRSVIAIFVILLFGFNNNCLAQGKVSRQSGNRPQKHSVNWKSKYSETKHYAYDYYFVKDNNKWGICNKGNIIVPCVYDEMIDHYGIIEVRIGDRWGVINGNEDHYSGIGADRARYREENNPNKKYWVKRLKAFGMIAEVKYDSVTYSSQHVSILHIGKRHFAILTGSKVEYELPSNFTVKLDKYGVKDRFFVEWGNNGVAIKVGENQVGYIGYDFTMPYEYVYFRDREEGRYIEYKRPDGYVGKLDPNGKIID